MRALNNSVDIKIQLLMYFYIPKLCFFYKMLNRFSTCKIEEPNYGHHYHLRNHFTNLFGRNEISSTIFLLGRC